MNKSLEVYFIRNAQTESNTALKLQGRIEGKLTEFGVKQSKLLGKELSRISFFKIYCSPLARARDTLKYTGVHSNIEYINELKERDFGDLTNLTYRDMIHLLPEEKPLQGESLVDMQLRIKKFLDKVIKENSSDCRIGVFSHHEVILSSVAYVIGLPLQNFRSLMISNASITQLDYYQNHWVVKRVNDLGHLGDLKITTRVY